MKEMITKQDSCSDASLCVLKNLIILFLRLLYTKDEELSLAKNRCSQVSPTPLYSEFPDAERDLEDAQTRIVDLLEANQELVHFYNSLLSSVSNGHSAPQAQQPAFLVENSFEEDEKDLFRQEIGSLRMELQTTKEDMKLLNNSNRRNMHKPRDA